MTPTHAATESANRTSLLSWEAIAEPHVPDRGPPSIPPDRRPNISLRDAVKVGTFEEVGRRVIFRPAIGSGAVHADAGNAEGFGNSRRIMPSVRFLLVTHLRAVLR